jgi:hypothetical protein
MSSSGCLLYDPTRAADKYASTERDVSGERLGVDSKRRAAVGIAGGVADHLAKAIEYLAFWVSRETFAGEANPYLPVFCQVGRRIDSARIAHGILAAVACWYRPRRSRVAFNASVDNVCHVLRLLNRNHRIAVFCGTVKHYFREAVMR